MNILKVLYYLVECVFNPLNGKFGFRCVKEYIVKGVEEIPDIAILFAFSLDTCTCDAIQSLLEKLRMSISLKNIGRRKEHKSDR